MVCLRRHATADAAECNVGDAVDDRNALPLSIPIEADAEAAKNDGKDHQAIGAADETHVILVEAKAVLLPNDHGVHAGGQAWEAARLCAHTDLGAGRFSALAGLEAAETAEHPLAALVVGPAGSRIYVIERLLAHVHLSAWHADRRGAPAARFGAGGPEHRDLHFIAVAGVGTESAAIFSIRLLRRLPV